MSGEKCSRASFEDIAARQAREAQQRAREAEERARRQREDARRRLEQMIADSQRSATALAPRIDALLLAPRSRFADTNLARQARRTVTDVAVRLNAGGLIEPQARELSSTLEFLTAQLCEQETAANTALAKLRSLEQFETRVENEFTALIDSSAGKYVRAESATRIRGTFDSLRRRLAECSGAELRQLEVAIGESHQAVRQANQEAQIISDEADTVMTGLRSAQQRLQQSAAECAAHWDSADSAEINGEIAAILNRLGACTNLAELRAQAQTLADVERKLSDRIVSARGRQRVASLAAEEAALHELIDRFQSIDERHSRKFAPADFDRLRRQLEVIDKLLKAGNLERGRESLSNSRKDVQRYMDRVATALKEWETARNAAIDSAQKVLGQWLPFREDAELRSWLPDEGVKIEKQLSDIQQAIDGERFVEAQKTANSLGSQIDSELVIARSLWELSTAAVQLRQELVSLHDRTHSRFDPVGRGNIEMHLSAAEKMVPRRNVESARQHLAEARRMLESHRATALAQHAEFLKARDAAAERVAAARDVVASLEQDTVICRWKPTEVRSLKERVERAEAALGAGRCADAVKGVDQIPKLALELAAQVAPLESQSSIQRQLASGIEQALRDLGFECDSGDEIPGNPTSAIILQAERQLGLDVPGKINVAVEPDGRLQYDVGGAFTKDETYDARLHRPVKSCDEAEQQLLELHAVLGRMGIKTGKITWEGQPPDDDTGTALATPEVRATEAPQEREQRSNRYGS